MPIQGSPNHPLQVGVYVFSESPVNADVLADGLHQSARDCPKLLVSQYLQGTVVSLVDKAS